MRVLLIPILLQLSSLGSLAQEEELISNNWYFSASDTLCFSQQHIRSNHIIEVKEYRSDKKYADSAQLMSNYFFDPSGSLTRSVTYDIHGTSSVVEFVNTPGGKLAEVWANDSKGIRGKTRENVYEGDKLMIAKSYYGANHVISVEYTYRKDGLLSVKQFVGANGIKGARTVFTYDSLRRLILQVTKNQGDTMGLCYFYKYDSLGRRSSTEYKEAGARWTETIDRSKSTATCKIEKKALDGRLTEVRTVNYNKQGLPAVLIIDKRMSIKRRRKPNIFCGYQGPLRYQKWIYDYDAKGNRVSEKEYHAPHKLSRMLICEFDDRGNMVRKTIYDGRVKNSEWSYSYH